MKDQSESLRLRTEMEGGAEDRRIIVRAALFAVISILLCAASFALPIRQWWQVDRLVHLGRQLGWWGPVGLIALGIVTPLLLLPRWPLAVVSGLLYGIVPGAVLANLASTFGALVHYAMARSMLAPWCRAILERRRSRWLDIPPGQTFTALLLLRAVPVSNFVATNILAGTLRVRVRTYLAASFLGMIPSSVMYAAWGQVIRQPSPVAVALAVGLVVIVLIGTWFVRHRRGWTASQGPPGGGQPCPN